MKKSLNPEQETEDHSFCRNLSATFDLNGCTLLLTIVLICVLSSPPSLTAESYSVAGSEGSIAPSVGSAAHQASGSTSPCSHSSSGGSRHPVSTLKKWLTNPVRKLSSDPRSGAGKAEKQRFRPNGKDQPSPTSNTETQQSSLEMNKNYIILSSDHKTMVRLLILDKETLPSVCTRL